MMSRVCTALGTLSAAKKPNARNFFGNGLVWISAEEGNDFAFSDQPFATA